MITRSNILVMTPDRNTLTQEGKPQNDYTGAFLPESKKFCELHRVPDENVVRVDPTQAMERRLERVMGAMTKATKKGPLDMLVFFCHGWPQGIQMGLTKKNVGQFCKVWGPQLTEDVVVVMYSCFTADGEGSMWEGAGGDGGFADAFRDGLVAAGRAKCRVYGHSTLGHTTRNPFVRVFRGELAGGGNGEWVVDPSHSARWAKWKAALAEKDPQAWRLKFPLMSSDEIEAMLSL